MTLRELAGKLGLHILNPGSGLEREATGGCTADLPSDALGRIGEGTVWITSRMHRNAVAVASFRKAVGIVCTDGARPDRETLHLAAEEDVAVLSAEGTSFEVSGRIYEALR